MLEYKLLLRYNTILKNYTYSTLKRVMDLFVCIILFPVFFFISFLLLFLNIFLNKGKVYFIQKRMGLNCEPFYAIKFRTMKPIASIERKYSDPLETDRITKLGYFLRKTKVDELPQILNVLKGDMSLIGPRPDYYEHALSFMKYNPSYKFRHIVKPGISGLSQIRLGYAEGLNATNKKTKVDIFYIKNASLKLDLYIFLATLALIKKGFLR
ncbi:sugar transferase [Amylibacter sp.]|jgi:lipopolysaccharide/colanic/teichoic acid biosynthesis glycosyltransferase|nr:sugar transferase [Amylibacter sp.]